MKLDKDIRAGKPYRQGSNLVQPFRIRKRALWRTHVGVRVVAVGFRILPQFLRKDIALRISRGLQ